jgi:hypothetical protein
MEDKTTRHGNILFIVFFLNQTTKKTKERKGKTNSDRNFKEKC